jgi:hypothetical protein
MGPALFGAVLALANPGPQVAAPVPPPSRVVGIGVVAGEPLGIGVKGWFLGLNAWSVEVTWDFTDQGIGVSAQYLRHVGRMAGTPGVTPYLGVGPKLTVRLDGEVVVGLRFPLGVALQLGPCELFGELAPGALWWPRVEFDLNGALGARLYF